MLSEASPCSQNTTAAGVPAPSKRLLLLKQSRILFKTVENNNIIDKRKEKKTVIFHILVQTD